MNFYLLERRKYGWDEFVSAVIVASNPREARDLAPRGWAREAWERADAVCIFIDRYTGRRRKPFILHEHYRAG